MKLAYAIDMVKQLKQCYTYKSKQYKLPELKKFVNFEGARNIFSSLVVTTKTGTPVKIVFALNGNKKSECFFKSSISFLKLRIEFQFHNYGVMVNHTTNVFTRYIILLWINRNQNNQKTYGELFYMFCEDNQDMDLTNTLQSLMALIVEHISTIPGNITPFIKSKITECRLSQALFIQALFRNIFWES